MSEESVFGEEDFSPPAEAAFEIYNNQPQFLNYLTYHLSPIQDTEIRDWLFRRWLQHHRKSARLSGANLKRFDTSVPPSKEITDIIDWCLGDQRERVVQILKRSNLGSLAHHGEVWSKKVSALSRREETSDTLSIGSDIVAEEGSYRCVWLRTHDSLVNEGAYMGNCLGSKTINPAHFFFSIRDLSGMSHVNFYYRKDPFDNEFKLAEVPSCRGNSRVPFAHQYITERFVALMAVRLNFHARPDVHVPDGSYYRKGTRWLPQISAKDEMAWKKVTIFNEKWGDEKDGETILKRTDGKLHAKGVPAIEDSDFEAWYENGKVHRVGGPAVKTSDSSSWFLGGELHREGDEPAHRGSDGSLYYYRHGVYHRDDGKPAVLLPSGRKEYWVSGRRHRVDGPAIEAEDGGFEYYLDGERHRLGGPAVITADGRSFDYLYGVFQPRKPTLIDDIEYEFKPHKLRDRIFFKITTIIKNLRS